MSTNGFDKEMGKARGTSAWLFIGLLVSIAGMAAGAGMLIWHIAKLILK